MDGRVFYFGWEISCIEWLQDHIGTVGTALAGFFTMFGEAAFIVAIFGLLYWCIDKKTAKVICTGLLVALVVNPMIKNVVLRRRPYFDNDHIKCLKPVNSKADIYDIPAQGFSFPSAHSMDSVIVYGGLTALKKKFLYVAAVLLPLLVGVSRVALGVHYPTDVITGWILGIIIAVCIPRLLDRANNKNLLRLVIFLISLTGVFYCRTDDYFTGLGMMAGFFLAIPFEEKYVSFEETREPLKCILRVAGGVILHYVIGALLKLPFPKEFLTSGTMPAYLVRSARYAVSIFILFAVYPMLFGRIRLIRPVRRKKK